MEEHIQSAEEYLFVCGSITGTQLSFSLIVSFHTVSKNYVDAISMSNPFKSFSCLNWSQLHFRKYGLFNLKGRILHILFGIRSDFFWSQYQILPSQGHSGQNYSVIFFFFSWQIQSLSPSKNKSLFLAVPCPSQKDNSLLLAASLSLVNYPVVSPALCISPITRNSTGNTLHQSGLTFFSKLTCTRVPVCVSTHACVHVILEHLRQES